MYVHSFFVPKQVFHIFSSLKRLLYLENLYLYSRKLTKDIFSICIPIDYSHYISLPAGRVIGEHPFVPTPQPLGTPELPGGADIIAGRSCLAISDWCRWSQSYHHEASWARSCRLPLSRHV